MDVELQEHGERIKYEMKPRENKNKQRNKAQNKARKKDIDLMFYTYIMKSFY